MKELNLILIKQRRKEMRITLQEMADSLGFKNASTYFKYESGLYKFNAVHLPIVCKKLKIKVNDVFFTPIVAELAN